MNLEKCLTAYEYYSGKASEIARTLSLSGIAIIWVLRDPNSSAFLSPALYWPGVFFVGALAADLLHYVYGAVVWGVFHRRMELRGLARDAEFKAPRWVNWPTFVFFAFKLLLVAIGYALLLTHLLGRLPSTAVPPAAPGQTVPVPPPAPPPAPNPTSAPKVSLAGFAIDPGVVSVAEALGVWAAVIVALFWPPIQGWFTRPKLSIRATPERQSFHKTHAVLGNGPVAFDCYYYRLDVINDGRSAARDVEVFARAAFRRTSNGNFEKVERFLPQWFCWATWRDLQHERRIFMPVIPPRAARYFDFGHVLDPAGRELFALDLENDAAQPKERAILSLDLAVRYQRLGHLLPAGHYALVLEVSAANAEPTTFVVVVDNPGVWDADETKMLTSGVKVETVRSLKKWDSYDAVKGLLGAGE